MDLLVIALIAVVVAGVVAIAINGFSKRKAGALEAWEAAGAYLGLDFLPGSGTGGHNLTGKINDMTVRVEDFGSLRCTVQLLAPDAPDMAMSKRSGKRRTGVVTGDEAFDSVVKVKSTDDEGVVASYLTPARREVIAELFAKKRFFDVGVSNVEVTATQLKGEVSRDQLIDLVASQMKVALQMGPQTSPEQS